MLSMLMAAFFGSTVPVPSVSVGVFPSPARLDSPGWRGGEEVEAPPAPGAPLGDPPIPVAAPSAALPLGEAFSMSSSPLLTFTRGRFSPG